MSRRVIFGAALLGLALVLGPGVDAPRAETPDAAQSVPDPDEVQFRQRLELQIRSGQRDQAIEMLEERRREKGLAEGLRRRLANLYREARRYEELEALLLELSGGDLEAADLGQLRLLAEARFELGRRDEALEVLRHISAQDPEDPARARLVAQVLTLAGELDAAAEVLEEARARAEDPLAFAQLLARLQVSRGELEAAVREYCRMVIANPLNISLVRGQVLQLADDHPQRIDSMRVAAEQMRKQNPQAHPLSLVIAELLLRSGDEESAWRSLSPHLSDAGMTQEVLRLALAGLADSRVPGTDPSQSMKRLRFSARIARGLLDAGALPQTLQPRAWDTFTRSLTALLENEAFLQQPIEEQLEVLDTTRAAIMTMRERFAGNRMTASAMLRLADLYATTLHRPAVAAEIYRSLAQDPNASVPQIHAARLGLATSHVAAGDTARARILFEEIGRDMEFVEGQGRAQYHLGQLDFMAGEFETAQDRLKAVAAEAPRAEYANDALDLALILAEEEMSGEADGEGLRRYGRMLYHRAVAQSDSVLHELEQIVEGRPGPLQARARLDLARLHRSVGEADLALARVRELVTESPESRHAPAALELMAGLYERLGLAPAALATYERLLVDHASYVYLDRVRDRIRGLREAGVVAQEGDLP